MADNSTAAPGETVANNLQRTIVSMIRFSSAIALYGVEKMQGTLAFRERQELSTIIDDMGGTLDSLTETLEGRMVEGNRTALHSATNLVGQIVEQSCEGLSLLDPRHAVRAATDLIRKTADTFSGSAAEAKLEAENEPALAVEVLTASASR